MEDNDAVQKPVVVDPPLYSEASPSVSPRRPVVIAADAAPRPENQLIQRIQRALAELRELRNQFNAILREIELEVGGEEEPAESSVEDPEDEDSDSYVRSSSVVCDSLQEIREQEILDSRELLDTWKKTHD